MDLCTHPIEERDVVTYPAAGFLGVPTGARIVCTGCGTDQGPSPISTRARLMAVSRLRDRVPTLSVLEAAMLVDELCDVLK